MRSIRPPASFLALILAGCLQSTAGPDPPPPTSIQPIQSSMSGQVGAQIEPAVRVLDAFGVEMSGISVLWTGSEGLTINPSSSRTDGSGIATTVVTIGTVAGQFDVIATATGLSPVTITVEAQPGPGRTLVLSDESITFTAVQQTRKVDVVAADQHGNQIPASAITWVSRNTAIAEVNATGTITSRGAGQTFVVASTGQAQDSVAVTVTP